MITRQIFKRAHNAYKLDSADPLDRARVAATVKLAIVIIGISLYLATKTAARHLVRAIRRSHIARLMRSR